MEECNIAQLERYMSLLRSHRHNRHHRRRVVIIIINIPFLFFSFSSNRPSDLLRAPAISLGVSHLTVFH